MTKNGKERLEREKKRNSFDINEELMKRGANGKPVSFKMTNKGDGRGMVEDFDDDDDIGADDNIGAGAGGFPHDDYKMPEDDGSDGGADWSKWPFTDVDSPFKV